MTHDEDQSGAARVVVTLADLEAEFRRLQESKVRLVSMAEKAGLAVPRSCCRHKGKTPCISCAADWLVAYARHRKGPVD